MAYAKADGRVWHDTGKALDHYPTSTEMLEAAGLDFNVVRTRVQWAAETVGNRWRASSSRFVLYRDDTGDFLGIVGKDYQPDHPRDLFILADDLVQDGRAVYSTAGLIYSGDAPRIWCSLRLLGDDWKIAGEEHKPYIWLSSSWDTRQALHCRPVDIRVICGNTYALAMNQKEGLTIRHDARDRDALKAEAAKMLAVTHGEFDRFKVWAEIAALKGVSDQTRAQVEDIVAPPVRDLPGQPADHRVRAQAFRQRTLRKFNTIATEEISVGGNNAYSLFNAVTGYVDWGKKVKTAKNNTRSTSAMYSQLSGDGARIKRQAYELLSV
tara:strand:- start:1327 stop:2298 length:972 start_codon:yes stop_codon:yes gene_type:complete